jgi:hypothetical protein
VIPSSHGGSTQFDEPGSQLDQGQVGQDTDLITITIGGDDADFTGVMKECYFHACMQEDSPEEGLSFSEWVIAKIDSIPYETTFREITETAPNALVLALGYPRLFTEDISLGCPSVWPYIDEEDFLNLAADHLNTRLAVGAAAGGAHYVSVRDAFLGHEVCGSEGEWINGPSATGDWGLPPITSKTKVFHPNLFGQIGYGEIVNAFLHNYAMGNEPSGSLQSQRHAARALSNVGPLGSIEGLGVAIVSESPCDVFSSPGLKLTGQGFIPGSEVEVTATVPGQQPLSLGSVIVEMDGTATVNLPLPQQLAGQLVGMEMRGLDVQGAKRWLIQGYEVPEECA